MKREILKNFWVLEGLDGSGTTTQLKAVQNRADSEHLALRSDFEPTRGVIGSFLRQILTGQVAVTPAALPYLFCADRAEHLDGPQGLRAALAAGTAVLSDRYLFSSLAYQSQDHDWNWIATLNSTFPLPEKVFFLDIAVAEAQARIRARGGEAELFDAPALQEKIRLGYERAWRELADSGVQIIRIDATLPISEITAKIWAEIGR